MAEQNFTVADFFRLGNEAAAQESARRAKEAEALTESRIRLARAGMSEDDDTGK